MKYTRIREVFTLCMCWLMLLLVFAYTRYEVQKLNNVHSHWRDDTMRTVFTIGSVLFFGCHLILFRYESALYLYFQRLLLPPNNSKPFSDFIGLKNCTWNFHKMCRLSALLPSSSSNNVTIYCLPSSCSRCQRPILRCSTLCTRIRSSAKVIEMEWCSVSFHFILEVLVPKWQR